METSGILTRSQAQWLRRTRTLYFTWLPRPWSSSSYRVPIETFSVNIMGTVNVLEASRAMRVKGGRRQAIIVVTSDKCYAQNGSNGAYREADPIGGNDPYSSSKGCAELVTAAYHRSFADADIGIATVRAGNVVGGGDWAKN